LGGLPTPSGRRNRLKEEISARRDGRLGPDDGNLAGACLRLGLHRIKEGLCWFFGPVGVVAVLDQRFVTPS
jgi:hypothetical protein